MAQQKLNKTQVNFSGGINADASPLNHPENIARICNNFIPHPSGALIKRGKLVAKHETRTSWPNVITRRPVAGNLAVHYSDGGDVVAIPDTGTGSTLFVDGRVVVGEPTADVLEISDHIVIGRAVAANMPSGMSTDIDRIINLAGEEYPPASTHPISTIILAPTTKWAVINMTGTWVASDQVVEDGTDLLRSQTLLIKGEGIRRLDIILDGDIEGLRNPLIQVLNTSGEAVTVNFSHTGTVDRVWPSSTIFNFPVNVLKAGQVFTRPPTDGGVPVDPIP